MYKIYVKVEPDGDFYYKNNLPSFNRDIGSVELFCKERDSAARLLKSFYHHMCETIVTSKKCIQKTVQKIKDSEQYVDIILDKIEIFHIDFEYGNQYINIEISKIEPSIVKLQDSEDEISSYKTIDENCYLEFHAYDLVDSWDWDKIKSYEDYI